MDLNIYSKRLPRPGETVTGGTFQQFLGGKGANQAVASVRSGAKTIFIICNPREFVKIEVDVAICPVPGPEIIMGSTRMKAGSAQKMILNILTTTAMIKQGKVFENMMVDLQMNSKKLEERSKRTVMIITGIDYKESEKLLKQANGHVKTAVVMNIAGVNRAEAENALEMADGFVRQAISLINKKKS